MSDAENAACWMHLTCELCGGIHAAGEPCQTSDTPVVAQVDAPARGSLEIATGELTAAMVALHPGSIVVVPEARSSSITAGDAGLTWSSVCRHRE